MIIRFSSFKDFFCLLSTIVVVATIHENWCCSNKMVDSQKIFAVQLLHCFSAKKNCLNLFSTNDDVKDSLSCLHGIRVLTTCWIVLIHVAGELTQRISYTRKLDLKVISWIVNLLWVFGNFFYSSSPTLCRSINLLGVIINIYRTHHDGNFK